MLKHLSRIVSAVLLAGAVTAGPALSADLQEIIASGKVRIGVPVDVAPFGSNDANNQPDFGSSPDGGSYPFGMVSDTAFDVDVMLTVSSTWTWGGQ